MSIPPRTCDDLVTLPRLPSYNDAQHYAQLRPREELTRGDEEEQSDTRRVRARTAEAQSRSPWDSPVRDDTHAMYGNGSSNPAKGQPKGGKGYGTFQACPYCANPHHTGRDCPQTPSHHQSTYGKGGKGGKGKGKGPAQYPDQGQENLGRWHRGVRGRGKSNTKGSKGAKGGKGTQGQVGAKGQSYGKGLAPTQVFYIQHCAAFNSAANV